MKTRKLIIFLLLLLSCSAVGAEYVAIDGIVYRVSDENGNAWVHNIFSTNGTVTIPAYVTYRGVKYKVTGITKNDFNTSARNTYNFSSAVIGEGALTDLATLDAAVRENEERPFRADYDYTRSTIKTLNLPNTLVFIDEKAFDGMKSLTSLTIPASVKYLPDDGFIISNSIFRSYLPNLQSITILGVPEFEGYTNGVKCTITLTSQDENGNLNYLERIKEKFNLSYCRNLVSFSMPEYEKRIPVVKAFYKANQDLDNEERGYNSELNKVSKEAGLIIPTPALKDEACTDAKTVQEAYNQAHQYLVSMFENCKSYAILYDSLMTQLKQHPYYDGTVLTAKIPVLDPIEPQTATIAALNERNKVELISDYNDLVNGQMEQNLKVNHQDKYIAGYIVVHPEKKEAIEKLFLDYRCEDKQTQYKYIVAYLETGKIARTCRESQWSLYGSLYKSKEEFDKSYNKATSDYNFQYEIKARKAANVNLEALKKYVTSNGKNINLSNMKKKPNDQTSYVIKKLDELKRSYYYSDAVSYLIGAFPKVQKEYEKNGQYFKSEVEFFEAYTSDSYSSILKDKKK